MQHHSGVVLLARLGSLREAQGPCNKIKLAAPIIGRRETGSPGVATSLCQGWRGGQGDGPEATMSGRPILTGLFAVSSVHCLITVPSRRRISPQPPFSRAAAVKGAFAAAFSSISMPQPGFSFTHR